MNYSADAKGPSSSPEVDKHTEALRQAQQKFPTIEKKADNPAFKSKYATFEGCCQALLPHLTDAGFAMPTYHSGYWGPEMGWCCLGVLKHAASGQWTSALVPLINLPTERKDWKTGEIKVLPPNMQGFGGALTFAKRQLLLELTGAWVGEADDDANEVSGQTELPAERPARHVPQAKGSLTPKALTYQQGAIKAVTQAANEAEAKKHLDTVELRAREKSIPVEVFHRVRDEFSKAWKKEVVNG